MDVYHPVFVVGAGPGGGSSGNYLLGASYAGTFHLSAFYDFTGFGAITGFVPAPGMRYTHAGACSFPATIATFPVTVSGAPPVTVTGPSLSLDDTCSFWGVYGQVSYTGVKGKVQYCRKVFLQAYSDPAYAVPLAPTDCYPFPNWGFPNNQGNYEFVTNYSATAIGSNPFYLRAYFDLNGSGSLDVGDPYVNYGMVTPTTDGTLANISFGDSLIY